MIHISYYDRHVCTYQMLLNLYYYLPFKRHIDKLESAHILSYFAQCYCAYDLILIILC